MTNLEQVQQCGSAEEKMELVIKLCEQFVTDMNKFNTKMGMKG